MKLLKLNLNMKPLIKKLELSLKRGYTQETVTSTFKSVFRGRGLEFDRFRIYAPSDDAKDIDWIASLKAQDLLVRVLTEERNINVTFLFDVSNSMIFTSGQKLKCEYAAELIATLGFTMIEAGDNVGLVMFNEGIVKHIPGNIGLHQYYRITRAISDPANYGGDFDLANMMKYVTKLYKNGDIMFLISDFIGLKEGWEKSLDVMSRKFDVIGIMVRDKRDNSLEGSEGQFVLGNPYSGEDMLVDVKLIKGTYADYAKKQIKEVEDAFRRVGADFIMIDSGEDFVKPIIGLFNLRKQRWK